MNQAEYDRIRKKAERTKRNLLLKGVYLVLFWGMVLLLCGFLIPDKIYRFINKDETVIQKIPKPNQYRGILSGLQDDYLEAYRYYWYEMTQVNLHYSPQNLKAGLAFLGKQESYPLTSRKGNYDEVSYLIEERYVFNQLVDQKINSQELMAYVPTVFQPDIPKMTGFDDYIAYIRGFGEQKVGQMMITLKNRAEPEEARAMTDRLDILHYGIETPNGENFGYSEEMLQKATGATYNQRVNDVVNGGLQYLVEHFPEYGFLGWQTVENETFFFKDLAPVLLSDFADIQDYLDYNGIKVKTLYISGTCSALADWLDEHRGSINRMKLQGLFDNVRTETIVEGSGG